MSLTPTAYPSTQLIDPLTSLPIAKLTARVEHTWLLTEESWHALSLDLSNATAWWASTCSLSDEDDTLTLVIDASMPRPLGLATTHLLTPSLWLSTVARIVRERPEHMDLKHWYALRVALIAPDWLERLDGVHLDLILQLALFGELRYA